MPTTPEDGEPTGTMLDELPPELRFILEHIQFNRAFSVQLKDAVHHIEDAMAITTFHGSGIGPMYVAVKAMEITVQRELENEGVPPETISKLQQLAFEVSKQMSVVRMPFTIDDLKGKLAEKKEEEQRR